MKTINTKEAIVFNINVNSGYYENYFNVNMESYTCTPRSAWIVNDVDESIITVRCEVLKRDNVSFNVLDRSYIDVEISGNTFTDLGNDGRKFNSKNYKEIDMLVVDRVMSSYTLDA